MILGFNRRFKKPILEDTKIHTIRIDMHKRWRAGMTIHMATGARTSRYSPFDVSVCTGLQQIFMNCENGVIEARINGGYFYDLDTLAVNDGFDNVEEFTKWFFPRKRPILGAYYSLDGF